MAMVMEASPSLSSDSIPRLDAGPACLECCSFNSSASFIDMDPADLFSMRWTSCPDADADESAEFDFGLPCAAAQYWCHGNADSAVRDAILYCKRSVREQDV